MASSGISISEVYLNTISKLEFMDPKGNVLIKKEFVHTKLWPNKQFTLNGIVDLEKEYKEALAGNLCPVLDIAVGGDAYLVYCETKKGHQFIWTIEKGDTVGFIPIIKKNGVLMPAGLSPIEEFEYIAKDLAKKYNY